MENLFEYLQFGFFQRALIGSFILAILAGVMGVFTTMRRASFFGDAIAHSSLAGVAIGLWFGVDPVVSAFVYAVSISMILPWIKKQTEFNYDNLLGIVLPVSMGLGVLIFSLLPGYQPELLSFLFGSLLTITWPEIWFIAIISLIIAVALVFTLPKLTLSSFDSDYAKIIGIKPAVYETFYHFLLAFTIVAGVRLVGVVLVNALLIIPVSIGKLFSRSLKGLFIVTPLIGVVIIILGLVVSLFANTPSGASIAVVAGTLFMISLATKGLITWFR